MKYSLITFLLFTFSTFAQDIKMTWGKMHETKGEYRGSEQISNPNDFSKYNYFIEGVHHVYELYSYENLSMLSKTRMEVKIDGNYYFVEELLRINNLTHVFMSSSLTKDGIKLLVQKYDDNCKPVGEVIEVLSHGKKERAYNSNFWIKLSKDESKILIRRVIEKDSKSGNTYAYGLFDLNLKPLGKEHEMYGEQEYANGKFVKISKDENSNKSAEKRNLVLYSENGSENIFPMDTKGFNLEARIINSDEIGFLTISGMYYDKKQEMLAGTFSMKFDLNKNAFIYSSFDAFDKDIYSSGLTGKDLEKAKASNDPTELVPYFYSLREVLNIENDGVILLLDYKRRVTVGSESWMEDGDLYLFKYSKTGKLVWSKQIFHEAPALSSDSYRVETSFAFIQGQKFNLIFNDNLKYYQENGTFDGNADTKTTRYENKELYKLNRTSNAGPNVKIVNNIGPILMQIDLKSGENIERRILEQAVSMTIIPGFFEKTKDPRKVLMYARDTRGEGFGILEY